MPFKTAALVISLYTIAFTFFTKEIDLKNSSAKAILFLECQNIFHFFLVGLAPINRTICFRCCKYKHIVNPFVKQASSCFSPYIFKLNYTENHNFVPRKTEYLQKYSIPDRPNTPTQP